LKEITMSWQDALILGENENIIQSWKGNQEIEERVVERGSFGRKKIAKAKKTVNGFLVMTNQKLVFLEEHGVFGKSYHQTLTIRLENVQGVSQGGAVYKFISITDDLGRYLFHLRAQFDAFRNAVMEAIKRRKEVLEKARRKERVHIVLDFSSVRDYMNKGGLALQSVRCPECNAPLPLPDSGNQIECKHCGNIIYAQDILEKIKALIG
jgi:hypothetical protein